MFETLIICPLYIIDRGLKWDKIKYDIINTIFWNLAPNIIK